jgi:Fe-Mn family superoxide dismutase
MFSLKQLPYEKNALEPYISQKTLEFHYGKHHLGYVNKLNEVLQTEEREDLLEMNLETLVKNILVMPGIVDTFRTQIVNNAGQVYNHDIYWASMGGRDEEPTGALATAITNTFKSYEMFKAEFTKNGLTQFGSGWSWLSLDANNQLVLSKTSNADSPLMHGLRPLMVMDVWEHAYYLDYQNRRADYITGFWSVVNWRAVENRYNFLINQN